jgi:hypothetical protein
MIEFFTAICVYLAFVNIGKWIALREIKNPTGKAIPAWFAKKYQESPY